MRHQQFIKHTILVSFMLLTFFLPLSTSQAGLINFTDGGTGGGDFIYDPFLNKITNWTITVSGGTSGLPDFTYNPTNSTVGFSNNVSTPPSFNIPANVEFVTTSPSALPPGAAARTLDLNLPVALSPSLPRGTHVFPLLLPGDPNVAAACAFSDFHATLCVSERDEGAAIATVEFRNFIPPANVLVTDPPNDPFTFTLTSESVAPVPEPATLLLLGSGLAGLGAWGRKMLKRI